MRKAQFEKWSYDHNRKGPSQHERQHQSSYKSVGTNSVFCCSRVTVNKPWFLHEKLIFNLLGSKFFSLFTEIVTQVEFHEKIIPAKSDLSLSGAHENAPYVFYCGLHFTCLEQYLVSLY